MIEREVVVLMGTAVTLGVVHTILGPDHYLPFAALAKARDWTRRKTLTTTILCGIGHVAGSIFLGFLGIALGWTIGSMEAFEGIRGDWAAWALMGFGVAYGAWGIRKGIRGKKHSHRHVHSDGTVHDHPHGHSDGHAHVHESSGSPVTPWMLFIVFVLGPCEPLIPILMIPASQHSWAGVGLVAGVFAVATITTMCAMVLALLAGLRFVQIGSLERWAHALAGFSLFVCGGAIKWLGL